MTHEVHLKVAEEGLLHFEPVSFTYRDSDHGPIQVGLSTTVPSVEVMSVGEYNRQHGHQVLEWLVFSTFAAGLTGIPALMERRIIAESEKAKAALES